MFKPLGVSQMENSRKLWGVERFDLMQVQTFSIGARISRR